MIGFLLEPYPIYPWPGLDIPFVYTFQEECSVTTVMAFFVDFWMSGPYRCFFDVFFFRITTFQSIFGFTIGSVMPFFCYMQIRYLIDRTELRKKQHLFSQFTSSSRAQHTDTINPKSAVIILF